MRKVGVLFSAGVESTSLLVHYLSEGYLVYPIYVRCGLPWEETELLWAKRLWAYLKKSYGNLMLLKVLPAKAINPVRGEIEIPLRNFILLSGVVVEFYRKGIRGVAFGSLGIYPFPDNNREYFDRLQELVSEGLREPVVIETPFMGMEKYEVIKLYKDSVPYRLTFSCMHPVRNRHCGTCDKCVERREGFRLAGISDPTLYLSS
jgi:7-cyano-7-deazaguanine synthase